MPTPPAIESDLKSEVQPEAERESIISITVKEPTMIPVEEEPPVKTVLPPAPVRSLSPLPPISSQPIVEPEPEPEPIASSELQVPARPASQQFSVTGSMASSVTAIQPPIRVEINGRTNISSGTNQPPILTARQHKQSTSPTREQLSRK